MRRLIPSLPDPMAAAALLLALGIALWGLVPPAPAPADEDPQAFSSERAFAHVEAIAAHSRPIGSPGNAAARDYLVARLRGLGLEPVTQGFTVPDYYSGRGDVPVVNVFARIAGTAPTGAIVLMAHYDTVPETTGANDNASAVAAVLETGRALGTGPALHNDVILLFTDGEEPAPRYGSTAFVERHPYAKDACLVINLEAAGGSGASQLVEVSGNEGALISRYAAAVPRPAASSLVDDLVELIGGSSTDMAPFRDAGVAGFEFAYVRNSPIYHTPSDDVASVSLASLQHHGSHLLALTRTFGGLDLADLGNESQQVFFTLAGRVVLSYPTTLGVVLALVTGLLLGVTLWKQRRLGPVLRASGWLLLLSIGIAVVIGLAWRLLVGWLWTADGPGEAAAVVWLIAILAITATLTVLLGRRLMGWPALVLWWALALTTSLAMPGAGYLFAWPVLAAVAMSFARSRRIAFSVLAATVVLLAVPVLDFFFQMAQPRPGNVGSQMPEVMAVVALLAALVTALLAPPLALDTGLRR